MSRLLDDAQSSVTESIGPRSAPPGLCCGPSLIPKPEESNRAQALRTPHLRERSLDTVPISPLCLFLLLGGGAAFAATQLPKSSVGSRQLKRNAVNSQKVRNGSLRLADFKKAQRAKLRGARGSQGEIGAPGPAGPQGEPATALWAVVDENGNLVRGSGVLSASGKPGPIRESRSIATSPLARCSPPSAEAPAAKSASAR